jgi:hypothetical protein
MAVQDMLKNSESEIQRVRQGTLASRGPHLRTYLVVGGDAHERGVVAGNVARAARTSYRTISLSAAARGHRCAASELLRQAAPVGEPGASVLLIDAADRLFQLPPEATPCDRCADLDYHDTLDALQGAASTVLFAVDAPPGHEAWSGWRPDVVVYLTLPGARQSSGGAGGGQIHVRVGAKQGYT